MGGVEVLGPLSQGDLWRFSIGLVALLIAVGVLSILAALLTQVAFDLGARTFANRRGFVRWLDPLPEAATSFLKRLLSDDRQKERDHLPAHMAALHPQRLAAQVANRLHATAEADLALMLLFLADIDGLHFRNESDDAAAEPPKSDPEASSSSAVEEPANAARETALRRGTAARIDAAVDGLQARLTRQTLLAGYVVALASSLVISLLVYAALEVSLRLNYVLYALLAALFAGFVAALLHNRFDRPRLS